MVEVDGSFKVSMVEDKVVIEQTITKVLSGNESIQELKKLEQEKNQLSNQVLSIQKSLDDGVYVKQLEESRKNLKILDNLEKDWVKVNAPLIDELVGKIKSRVKVLKAERGYSRLKKEEEKAVLAYRILVDVVTEMKLDMGDYVVRKMEMPHDTIRILSKDSPRVRVDDFKPYQRNAKLHPPEQIERIKKSILEFGFFGEIVLNNEVEREIVCGHGRVLASKELGMVELPVVYANHLSKEQLKAYRLMDNKSAESDWVEEFLEGELLDLKGVGFDLSLTGFEDYDFLNKNVVDDSIEDDFDIDKASEELVCNIQKGDIWVLGNHKIICGDSTDFNVFKSLIKDEKINLCFTSPPYNMNSNMYKGYKDNLESEEYIKFNLSVVSNARKFIKGYLFWNISYNKNSRSEFLSIAERIKSEGFSFLEWIVWNKKTALPISSKSMLTRTYENIFVYRDDTYEDIDFYYAGTNIGGVVYDKKTSNTLSNYWEIKPNRIQLSTNLACFPVQIPAKAISLVTKENENVLDPFLGSGSTLIACEKLGRKCYGIELDNKLCQIIINRWEKLTGLKATKQ